MNARQIEKKVNAIVDEILNEDQENDFGAIRDETCPGSCKKLDDTPKKCKCGVETSLRFSLRVMEAMRLLQRDVDQPSTSSAEEITDYIRSHYRYNGDLYAQVRTALRQVCSQGFVMELLNNEYHLAGPVVRPIKRNGCSLDCKDRIIEFDADVSDIQDYRQRNIKMEQRDNYAEPIPGPFKKILRISSSDPARNVKKARVEDQRVEHADEKDETTMKKEDMDCACNAEVVTRDKLSRIRSPDRPRVIRNRRRRNDAEEDIEEGIKDGEEDEDTEDSIYDELRVRVPHRRTAAREQELRKWIRRCREECERRGGR
ncbi:PREDICTED: uncharacterized protein LOC105148254 [Acromyrmex echinatior]|uniref:H15 domain-containing protein n=1 Tax=Acromyrmex echinatior TaxID=103372 RepID=F4WR46_ACREC|nr:PREDICTED: uncharacterized protein LOC105148254 [Acromyrmex echinatior]EGI63273.1 hypothetical protein G5I_08301 [Acromyrmex echinatior]